MLLSATLLLSLNMQLAERISTPGHRKVILRSKICSMQVLAEVHSDLHAEISTADCFLLCESIGAFLRKHSATVTDLPIAIL